MFAWKVHGWPRTLERIDLATGKSTVTASLDPPVKPFSARAEVSADGGTAVFSYVDFGADLYVLAPPK